MSRSDSLSTSTSAHTRTDGVGAVGPLYQSVSDANTAHWQYRTEHVKSTVSQAPSSTGEPGTYAFIEEKESGGETPPKHLEAVNALYAGTQGDSDQFRHQTLNMEKGSMRFSGPTASYLVEPGAKKHRCTKLSTAIVALLLLVAITVAVAALALVMVMWFGIHSPPCNCAPSTPTEGR